MSDRTARRCEAYKPKSPQAPNAPGGRPGGPSYTSEVRTAMEPEDGHVAKRLPVAHSPQANHPLIYGLQDRPPPQGAHMHGIGGWACPTGLPVDAKPTSPKASKPTSLQCTGWTARWTVLLSGRCAHACPPPTPGTRHPPALRSLWRSRPPPLLLTDERPPIEHLQPSTFNSINDRQRLATKLTTKAHDRGP